MIYEESFPKTHEFDLESLCPRKPCLVLKNLTKPYLRFLIKP
jgi:hypothetical protein